MNSNSLILGLTNTSKDVIIEYINNGLNVFDTSPIYEGQNCLRNLLDEKIVNRSNIIIMSKLWLDEMGNNRSYDTHTWGEDNIESNTIKIINSLNCDYLDCLFIHWPLKLDKDLITEEFIIQEIWIQMERLVDKGLIRHIGLSNFGILEIQTILNICKIKPFINQIEVNLYNTNNCIIKFCKKVNIKLMGHSLFRLGECMNECILYELANKYNVSKHAILINWLMQKGVNATISTTKIENLQNNLLYNSFNLMNDEIIQLDNLNKNQCMRMYDYMIHNLDHDYKYNFNKYKITYCDNTNLEFNDIYTDDIDFLKKCQLSLTIGPGFIILRNLFSEDINIIREKLPKSEFNTSRWNNSVIDKDLIFCKLIDNILIKTIIENILGWDCHLDNTAFSYSRFENGEALPFGPHIDSPFDMKPGAKLPPCEYPLVLQCLYVFDDMKKSNGGFYAIPYSHKQRMRCNLFSEGNMEFGKVPDNAFEINASAGDVIIAIGNIWHGAFINEDKTDRRILLAEFVSSIIEKRDHLGSGGIGINMNILKDCSRRMIRLLNEGRGKWRDSQNILQEWKQHQKKLIMNKFY
jgi:diketogulonate reductase-like aldo/keto reductase